MDTSFGDQRMKHRILAQIRSNLAMLGADDATLKKLELRADGAESLPVGEIYSIAEQLGADSHLLAAIGSWGDTQPARVVLEDLKEWIEVEERIRGNTPKA